MSTKKISEPAPRRPGRNRRRILRRTALGLAALLVLLVFALLFLFGTEAGTRVLFTRLGGIMPGSFDVEELKGPIRGPLDIRGLTYEREGLKLRIDHLQLEWRLRELLERRLDVERLWADGIQVVTTPGEEEEEPSPLPDLNLRFNIIVRDARVTRLSVGSSEGGAPPFVVDRIDLATTAIENVFRVDRLAVRSALVNADVTGRVQPQGDYPVDLRTVWSVRPEGMAEVSGRGTLSGTLKRLQVTQSVGAPFPVRLAAVLTEPLYDLRFDARTSFTANPRLLRPDFPDLPARGDVAIAGSLEDFTSRGTVRGAMAPAGAFALDYRLARQGDTWRIERAEATLPGTRTRAVVSGRLAFQGENAERMDGEGTVAWRNLAWPPRQAEPAFASAAGRARVVLQGKADAFTSRGTVDAAVAPYGRLAADYRLARQGDLWTVERADVTVPGTRARLTARGRARVRGETVDLAGNAAWRNLAWPLRGTPLVRSAAGSAEVSGSTERYRARVRADVAGAPGGQIPPGRWALAGEGDTTSFRIASLTGDVLSGRIAGSGRVAWSPRVAWDVALDGQGLDPAHLRPDLPGRISLAVKSRGEMLPEGPAGSVEVPRLSGTLRGQPLAATAALRLAGERYDLRRMNVTWGPARASASGLLGDHLDLAWQAAVPNLALALPRASGGVTGRGRLVGPAARPRITAEAAADSLQVAGQVAGQATLTADVDLAPGGATRLDVDARRVSLGGQAMDRLVVAARGTTERHTLTASATGLAIDPADRETRLDVALGGGLAGELGPKASWRGELSRLDLVSRTAGSWSLEKPAALAAGAEAASLSDLCWRSGGARLCAAGGWSKTGPWTAEATLASLPLSLAQAMLPAGSTISGEVNGSFSGRGGAAGLENVTLDLAPGPGELRYPAADGRTLAVRFERGSVSAVAGPAGGDARAVLTLTGIGGLTAEARLPPLRGGGALTDQPLSGRVQLALSDLGFTAGLVPAVRDVSGRLDAGFRLAGTLGAPRLDGQARLSGGRARVPEYGIDLKDIELTATGDGKGPLTLRASARSGPGTVTLAGTTGMLPSDAAPLRLEVDGRRFQALGTREIQVEVSPDLDVSYDGTLARVTGQLEVPRARVEIEKRPKPGAVTASKDVVFVGAAPGPVEAEPALAVAARVRVVLGDDIEMKVLGLAGKPRGSILAIEEPGKPPSATGEIEMAEGTFKAYGQDLTIERGRLVFAGGPLADPGIDLRAYRKADDGTTAGIEARGTLRVPEVTLWSDPPMTETEALAYLLLGHPLGEATPEEGSLLANAAESLELKGGNMIAKRLGARFGLQQASIETEGGLDEASLMLGKYLSPRLYVIYGIGLFQPVNTLRVRYILNKKFTLQAETGAGTSGDVLYTRERQ